MDVPSLITVSDKAMFDTVMFFGHTGQTATNHQCHLKGHHLAYQSKQCLCVLLSVVVMGTNRPSWSVSLAHTTPLPSLTQSQVEATHSRNSSKSVTNRIAEMFHQKRKWWMVCNFSFVVVSKQIVTIARLLAKDIFMFCKQNYKKSSHTSLPLHWIALVYLGIDLLPVQLAKIDW